MESPLPLSDVGRRIRRGGRVRLRTTLRSAGDDGGLPPALKKIEEKEPDGTVKKPRTKISGSQLRETLARGNKWMQDNYVIDPIGYTHYYMYALERYMSFRELTDKGASKKLSPATVARQITRANDRPT